MNIGIIKPGTKEYYLNEDKSLFGGFSEIKGTYDILIKKHNVDILYDYSNFDLYDRIIIFNSPNKISDRLKNSKTKKSYIITDLNLVDKVDGDVFTQSTLDKNYLPFEQLCLRYLKGKNKEKNINFIYAGGTRGGKRDKYFKKYLNPKRDYVTKIITSSGLEIFKHKKVINKIPFNELQKIYENTKYSIVIADDEYNEKNMLTQRYWEYLSNDVLAFVDYNYDKQESIIKKNDFRSVKNSSELEYKINILNDNDKLYNLLLIKQRQELEKTRNYINSNKFENYFTNKILGVKNEK